MSNWDLIGEITSIIGIFTAQNWWIAALFTIVAIIFYCKFENDLKKMECGEDEYSCMEDDE